MSVRLGYHEAVVLMIQGDHKGTLLLLLCYQRMNHYTYKKISDFFT